MVNFIRIPKFINPEGVAQANSISGVNPTGTITLKQSFEMNGSNNKIQSTSNIAEDNLKKSNINQFNCNLENFSSVDIFKKLRRKKNMCYLLVILIIIIILIILYELFKK